MAAAHALDPLPLPRLEEVRAATLRLAEGLSAEDMVVQSMPDASPVKWHLAHTTWFFETLILLPRAPGYQAFHPGYARLFNSYYETLGARHPRPQRGLLTRPSREEVLQYRGHVDAALRRNWAALPPDLLRLGLHHEQQHQELILTDLKHLLSCNPLRPAYAEADPDPGSDAAPAMGWRAFEGGLVAIGHEGPGFAFDNEGPRHQVYLRPFRMADRCVTESEYLAFMEDGGYADPAWWLSEGWDLVRSEGWEAPGYWFRDGSRWSQFTLHGTRAAGSARPVCHLSFFEADAYAKWAGKRLPLETEWELAASQAGEAQHPMTLHPTPIEAGPGFRQLFGGVWEWTSSPYAPYPGYRAAAGPVGEYNGKFMVNQMVLRGGSCLTPPGHIRATYRNFFPPSARWQVSGIRLAEDA